MVDVQVTPFWLLPCSVLAFGTPGIMTENARSLVVMSCQLWLAFAACALPPRNMQNVATDAAKLILFASISVISFLWVAVCCRSLTGANPELETAQDLRRF